MRHSLERSYVVESPLRNCKICDNLKLRCCAVRPLFCRRGPRVILVLVVSFSQVGANETLQDRGPLQDWRVRALSGTNLDLSKEVRGNYISSVGALLISSIPVDSVEESSTTYCVAGDYFSHFPFEEVLRDLSFTFTEKAVRNFIAQSVFPIKNSGIAD